MYDIVIKLNPTLYHAFINKGNNIYELKGDSLRLLLRSDEAIKMYDVALQFNPREY